VNTSRRYFVTKTKWACRANTQDRPRRISFSDVIDQCYNDLVSIVRYRYRAYPTRGQTQMLARTFGCARVVFNDALRTRQDTHAAGEKISDTEVQRRVVTLAKTTDERGWLGEVASVALVQACQDARRAYRNWFDSLSGKRKGRKVGQPRFRSRKDNRQSIRLTRNGFDVTARGVRVAKVGNVRLEWSRPLPSVPSSVTVIREAGGRYYASFVVEVADTPLPPSRYDVGIDLGLNRLVSTSDGEIVDNPRHLRRKARKLAYLQRALARKTKGSANRRKAVCRVAVAHRKVRETRLDQHHKLALRLVRDNQAVYVEDLAVSGLARTWLAKSVHDVGWATLVRLIEEKAARCHRQVVKVGRWFPSSQLCSTCGHRDESKPLDVRSWTCTACGTEHDRDVNAARNILAEGRRLAAGLADNANACRGDVRPGLVPAVAGEAGTRRGAA
jgi:putative transposase